MREPTRLTRLLQIGLPAYFIIGTAVAVAPAELRAIGIQIATGRKNLALMDIATLAVWIFVVALLTYGSLRKWRWSFWIYLVLLGLLGVSAVQDGILRTTLELFSDPIGALLLVASIVGLVRFGPWAMKRSRVRPSLPPSA